MQGKITVNYISLFFIVPFSGFYVTKLPISPIYVFVMIGFYFFLTYTLLIQKFYWDNMLLLTFVVLLYFLFSQIIFSKPDIASYVGINFSLSIFMLTYMILNKMKNINSILVLAEKIIIFSIPLLIFEAYYRLTHPVIIVDFAARGQEELEFYYLKFNSIMFMDSNFVGIFILTLFFFQLYLMEYTKKKYLFRLFLLSLLIFTTLSRASIISLLIFSFLWLFRKKIYKYKIFFIIAFVVFILTVVPFLYQISYLDPSFGTKFDILLKSVEYLLHTDVPSLLFGVGFGNTKDVLDIGAHNIVVAYLIESGLLGLVLITFLWLCILKKTRFKAGIVMFPFLLNGMSLSGHAIPYLYAMFSIILVLERKKRQCMTN